MYIRGLIPRNFAELAEAAPIETLYELLLLSTTILSQLSHFADFVINRTVIMCDSDNTVLDATIIEHSQNLSISKKSK